MLSPVLRKAHGAYADGAALRVSQRMGEQRPVAGGSHGFSLANPSWVDDQKRRLADRPPMDAGGDRHEVSASAQPEVARAVAEPINGTLGPRYVVFAVVP